MSTGSSHGYVKPEPESSKAHSMGFEGHVGAQKITDGAHGGSSGAGHGKTGPNGHGAKSILGKRKNDKNSKEKKGVKKSKANKNGDEIKAKTSPYVFLGKIEYDWVKFYQETFGGFRSCKYPMAPTIFAAMVCQEMTFNLKSMKKNSPNTASHIDNALKDLNTWRPKLRKGSDGEPVFFIDGVQTDEVNILELFDRAMYTMDISKTSLIEANMLTKNDGVLLMVTKPNVQQTIQWPITRMQTRIIKCGLKHVTQIWKSGTKAPTRKPVNIPGVKDTLFEKEVVIIQSIPKSMIIIIQKSDGKRIMKLPHTFLLCLTAYAKWFPPFQKKKNELLSKWPSRIPNYRIYLSKPGGQKGETHRAQVVHISDKLVYLQYGRKEEHEVFGMTIEQLIQNFDEAREAKALITYHYEDDDCQLVNHSAPAATTTWAHLREQCGKYLFSTITPNTCNPFFCPNCYCYVCDTPASECKKNGTWEKHCHAHSKSNKWIQQRNKRKTHKSATSAASSSSSASSVSSAAASSAAASNNVVDLTE